MELSTIELGVVLLQEITRLFHELIPLDHFHVHLNSIGSDYSFQQLHHDIVHCLGALGGCDSEHSNNRIESINHKILAMGDSIPQPISHSRLTLRQFDDRSTDRY